MSAVLGDSLARGLVKTRVREAIYRTETLKFSELASSSRQTNFHRQISNIKTLYRPVEEKITGDGKRKEWVCMAFDFQSDGRMLLLKITVPFKSPQSIRTFLCDFSINPHCVQRFIQMLGSIDLSLKTIGILLSPHIGALAVFLKNRKTWPESLKTFRVGGEMVIWRAYGSGYEAITVIDCDKLDGVNLRDYQRLLAGYQVDNAYLIGGEHGCNP